MTEVLNRARGKRSYPFDHVGEEKASSCMEMGSPEAFKRRREEQPSPSSAQDGQRGADVVFSTQRVSQSANLKKRGRDEMSSVSYAFGSGNGEGGDNGGNGGGTATAVSSSGAGGKSSLQTQDPNMLRAQLQAKDEVIRQLLIAKEASDTQLRGKSEENRILKRAVLLLEGRVKESAVSAERVARLEGENKQCHSMLQYASEVVGQLQHENEALKEALRTTSVGGPSHFITPQPPPDVF